jgi:hypothetical protein
MNTDTISLYRYEHHWNFWPTGNDPPQLSQIMLVGIPPGSRLVICRRIVLLTIPRGPERPDEMTINAPMLAFVAERSFWPDVTQIGLLV